MRGAFEEYNAALDRASTLARPALVEELRPIFEKHTFLKRISWQLESEYNDEGGYYDLPSVSLDVDEDRLPEDFDEDDLRGQVEEILRGFHYHHICEAREGGLAREEAQ
jgi:hypothetical protein